MGQKKLAAFGGFKQFTSETAIGEVMAC